MQAQNRDVDIAPFLKGANAVFQKFIEDGLANIERSIGNNNTSSSAFTKRNIKTETNVMTHDKLDPDYWIERLKMLKVCCKKKFFASFVINFLFFYYFL